MELTDLKTSWQNAGNSNKNVDELFIMTRMRKNPVIKKLITKLIIEIVLLSFFACIYYDWFDGDQKPLYANVALIAGLLLYITNDILGLIAILRPISDANVRTSINNYLLRLKRLFIFSIITSALYSISLITFFTSVITFTGEKSILLIFLIIISIQLLWWSLRIWKKRINRLEDNLQSL